jgi:hypothetical protein
MKLRQFLSVMGVVALVAVIYSPSTIGFSASPGGDGGTGPADASASGTSMFLSYLHQAGYKVIVANTTEEAITNLQDHRKLVYVLVGADNPLPAKELQAFQFGYSEGDFSALVAEGNVTNAALVATFEARVGERAIVDPASVFQNDQVFTVDLALGSSTVTGVDDVAAPLLIGPGSPLRPVAVTPPSAYALGNGTTGPRTVIGAGSTEAGARALVITDSAPFTNFLFNYTQGGVHEEAFVAAMVSYVDPGTDPANAAPILLDASNYAAPKAPSFQLGLPVGPLVVYAIEQSLSSLNGYYSSFPSQVSSFLGGFGIHVSDGVATALVALIILVSVYGAVTRWFAPEKRGKDDQPQPTVERTIVAESQARAEFLETSRSKAGYVAALGQLYEVLDSIVLGEFGTGISSVDEGALAAKVGSDEAARAKKLFLSLSKFHDYATGERRFLFPPVLRWRALTARTTGEAEAFLNRLGMSIAGEEERPQAPLHTGERVRA